MWTLSGHMSSGHNNRCRRTIKPTGSSSWDAVAIPSELRVRQVRVHPSSANDPGCVKTAVPRL
jgi:hypothetical protein